MVNSNRNKMYMNGVWCKRTVAQLVFRKNKGYLERHISDSFFSPPFSETKRANAPEILGSISQSQVTHDVRDYLG
ncbi:hypothetical protein J6590_043243 [Homalodisca vitripennis]|nr:hypothetical protein J6590_043243 [Homalodisca vitripennis]